MSRQRNRHRAEAPGLRTRGLSFSDAKDRGYDLTDSLLSGESELLTARPRDEFEGESRKALSTARRTVPLVRQRSWFGVPLASAVLRLFSGSKSRGLSTGGRRAPSQAHGGGRLWSSRAVLDPRTRICVARHVRKSVLFARGVAGRGGGHHGPYRRTKDSFFSCRR